MNGVVPTASSKQARAKARITGIDASRGIALIGMLAIHVMPAHDKNYEPTALWLIASGTSAALFAFWRGGSRHWLIPWHAGKCAKVTGGPGLAGGPRGSHCRNRPALGAGGNTRIHYSRLLRGDVCLGHSTARAQCQSAGGLRCWISHARRSGRAAACSLVDGPGVNRIRRLACWSQTRVARSVRCSSLGHTQPSHGWHTFVQGWRLASLTLGPLTSSCGSS